MKKILVPIDFSDNSHDAAHYALCLAVAVKAQLFFIHCTSIKIPTQLPAQGYAEIAQQHIEEKQQELKNYIQSLCEKVGRNECFEEATFIVKNTAFVVESINESIQQNRIDLVVMGTHGATGIKKVLYGSNTANLIGKTDCPVLAIPQGFSFKPIFSLGYATELYNLKEQIATAAHYATVLNTRLDIFHVYPNSPEKINPAEIDNESFVKLLKKEYAIQDLRLYFVKTNKKNDLKEGVDTFITCYKPSMLLMFTHKRNFFENIFDGSESMQIAFHTKLPLLVVPIRDEK